MTPGFRPLLFGRHYDRFERNLGLLFAAAILVATFTAYALGVFRVTGGVFRVTGGVIVLPADATLVGFLTAVGIGYRRGGLLFAWLAQFGAYLGFRLDWALFGIAGRSFAGELAAFFEPTGLFVLGVGTLTSGTAGFGVGYIGCSARKRFKDWLRTADRDDE